VTLFGADFGVVVAAHFGGVGVGVDDFGGSLLSSGGVNCSRGSFMSSSLDDVLLRRWRKK
jgi:hypothetical protein